MAKKENISARCDKETKKKLNELAKKENRTNTNWLINKINKEHEKMNRGD